MTHFTCARWRAPMEDQSLDEAPVLVFQRGHVFHNGERVGTYEQSTTHFVAGLAGERTLIVPLNQDNQDFYSATFRLGDGDLRRAGALIRERIN